MDGKRYMVTHSLLNSWSYALKENPFEDMTSERDPMADFLATLRREPIPVNEAMQNGIDFEDLVTAILKGNADLKHSWYNAASEIASIIAHTTAAELKPDIAPKYWERKRFIGGTTVPGQRGSEKGRGWLTLTGSGPASWNLDGTPASVNDIVGNTMENMPGFRIYDGELQIFADNDAAHPEANNTAGSGAWKAILPSQVNDSHTLVAPGTVGTLKWNATGALTSGYYNPQLDTVISQRCVGGEYLYTAFKDLTVNSARVPYVPAILRELGITPIQGDTTEGRVYYRNQTGEVFAPPWRQLLARFRLRPRLYPRPLCACPLGRPLWRPPRFCRTVN